MTRLNLTLDPDTYSKLEKHAKQVGKPRARVAREILSEELTRQAALERQRKLATDYAVGRADAQEILKDLETPQLELLKNEEG